MNKRDVYIVSKMTNAVAYCFYTERRHPNDVPSIREKITILGGCGMPSHRSGFGERREDASGAPLWVADGIVTKVPYEKYERLAAHPLFKRHLAAGRVNVITHDIMGNHKAVSAISRDMAGQDSHALLTRDKVKERINIKTPGAPEPSDFRI